MPITTTQFPATINLSSLNGQTGFTMTGAGSSQSGYSVSSAGDINADGIADFVVGAPGAASSAGASYVVFGKADIGKLGGLTWASLNGNNGFVISGATAGDQSGWAVSSAGDINADGVTESYYRSACSR